jgi:hypothetical protein
MDLLGGLSTLFASIGGLPNFQQAGNELLNKLKSNQPIGPNDYQDFLTKAGVPTHLADILAKIISEGGSVNDFVGKVANVMAGNRGVRGSSPHDDIGPLSFEKRVEQFTRDLKDKGKMFNGMTIDSLESAYNWIKANIPTGSNNLKVRSDPSNGLKVFQFLAGLLNKNFGTMIRTENDVEALARDVFVALTAVQAGLCANFVQVYAAVNGVLDTAQIYSGVIGMISKELANADPNQIGNIQELSTQCQNLSGKLQMSLDNLRHMMQGDSFRKIVGVDVLLDIQTSRLNNPLNALIENKKLSDGQLASAIMTALGNANKIIGIASMINRYRLALNSTSNELLKKFLDSNISNDQFNRLLQEKLSSMELSQGITDITGTENTTAGKFFKELLSKRTMLSSTEIAEAKGMISTSGIDGSAEIRRQDLYRNQLEKLKMQRNSAKQIAIAQISTHMRDIIDVIAQIVQGLIRGDIRITKSIKDLQNQLVLIHGLRKNAIFYPLIGVYTTPAIVDQRTQFIHTLISIKNKAQQLTTDNALFGELATKINKLLEYVDSTAAKNNEAFRNMGVLGSAEEDYDVVPQLNTIIKNYDEIMNEFTYALNFHQGLKRLETAGQALQGTSAQHQAIRAEAFGDKINLVKDERDELLKKLENPTTNVTMDIYTKANLGVLAPAQLTGQPSQANREHWDAVKNMVRSMYEAKIKLWQTAEAFDSMLEKFIREVSKDPNILRDLYKEISANQGIANWFDENSGKVLTQWFDMFPTYVDGNIIPRYRAPQDYKEHYFTQLNATSRALTSDGNLFGGAQSDTRATSTYLESLGNHLIPMYATNYETHRRLALSVYQGTAALKNIFTAFINVAKKLGNDSIFSFMQPITMYQNFIGYLSNAAFTRGYNLTGEQAINLSMDDAHALRGAEPTSGSSLSTVNWSFTDIRTVVNGTDGTNGNGLGLRFNAPVANYFSTTEPTSFFTYDNYFVILAGVVNYNNAALDQARMTRVAILKDFGYTGAVIYPSIKSMFDDTDDIFVIMVQGMYSKIMTAIDINRMLHRPIAKEDYRLIRSILGGDETNFPDAKPDYAGLYLGLVLMAEFYRDIFSLNSPFSSQQGAAGYFVGIIPDGMGNFGRFVSMMFDFYKDVKDGLYAEYQVREIVSAVNELIGKYDGEPLDRTNKIIDAFVADINARYALMSTEDANSYSALINEQRAEIVDPNAGPIRSDDLAILPGEMDPFAFDSANPSSSYVKTTKYDSKYSNNGHLASYHINEDWRKLVNKFRSKIDDYVISAQSNVKSWGDESLITDMIARAEYEMKNSKDPYSRYLALFKLLGTSSSNLLTDPARALGIQELVGSVDLLRTLLVQLMKTLDTFHAIQDYDKIGKAILGAIPGAQTTWASFHGEISKSTSPLTKFVFASNYDMYLPLIMSVTHTNGHASPIGGGFDHQYGAINPNYITPAGGTPVAGVVPMDIRKLSEYISDPQYIEQKKTLINLLLDGNVMMAELVQTVLDLQGAGVTKLIDIDVRDGTFVVNYDTLKNTVLGMFNSIDSIIQNMQGEIPPAILSSITGDGSLGVNIMRALYNKILFTTEFNGVADLNRYHMMNLGNYLTNTWKFLTTKEERHVRTITGVDLGALLTKTYQGGALIYKNGGREFSSWFNMNGTAVSALNKKRQLFYFSKRENTSFAQADDVLRGFTHFNASLPNSGIVAVAAPLRDKLPIFASVAPVIDKTKQGMSWRHEIGFPTLLEPQSQAVESSSYSAIIRYNQLVFGMINKLFDHGSSKLYSKVVQPFAMGNGMNFLQNTFPDTLPNLSAITSYINSSFIGTSKEDLTKVFLNSLLATGNVVGITTGADPSDSQYQNTDYANVFRAGWGPAETAKSYNVENIPKHLMSSCFAPHVYGTDGLYNAKSSTRGYVADKVLYSSFTISLEQYLIATRLFTASSGYVNAIHPARFGRLTGYSVADIAANSYGLQTSPLKFAHAFEGLPGIVRTYNPVVRNALSVLIPAQYDNAAAWMGHVNSVSIIGDFLSDIFTGAGTLIQRGANSKEAEAYGRVSALNAGVNTPITALANLIGTPNNPIIVPGAGGAMALVLGNAIRAAIDITFNPAPEYTYADWGTTLASGTRPGGRSVSVIALFMSTMSGLTGPKFTVSAGNIAEDPTFDIIPQNTHKFLENLFKTIPERVQYMPARMPEMPVGWGIRRDPKPQNVLFTSVGYLIQQIISTKPDVGDGYKFQFGTLTDISDSMKEVMVTYIPYLLSGFEVLSGQCAVLSQIVKSSNGVTRISPQNYSSVDSCDLKCEKMDIWGGNFRGAAAQMLGEIQRSSGEIMGNLQQILADLNNNGKVFDNAINQTDLSQVGLYTGLTVLRIDQAAEESLTLLGPAGIAQRKLLYGMRNLLGKAPVPTVKNIPNMELLVKNNASGFTPQTINPFIEHFTNLFRYVAGNRFYKPSSINQYRLLETSTWLSAEVKKCIEIAGVEFNAGPEMGNLWSLLTSGAASKLISVLLFYATTIPGRSANKVVDLFTSDIATTNVVNRTDIGVTNELWSVSFIHRIYQRLNEHVCISAPEYESGGTSMFAQQGVAHNQDTASNSLGLAGNPFGGPPGGAVLAWSALPTNAILSFNSNNVVPWTCLFSGKVGKQLGSSTFGLGPINEDRVSWFTPAQFGVENGRLWKRISVSMDSKIATIPTLDTDIKHAYPIALSTAITVANFVNEPAQYKSLKFVADYTLNTDSKTQFEDLIKDLSLTMVGRGPTPVINSREMLRKHFLSVYNIIPINANLMSREIAFGHGYNAAYNFRRYMQIRLGMSASQTGDDYLTLDDASSASEVCYRLLANPYASVSIINYEKLIGGLMRGNNDLDLGRPQFLSDQVFSKAMLGSLYESGERLQPAGPRTSKSASPNNDMAAANLAARTIMTGLSNLLINNETMWEKKDDMLKSILADRHLIYRNGTSMYGSSFSTNHVVEVMHGDHFHMNMENAGKQKHGTFQSNLLAGNILVRLGLIGTMAGSGNSEFLPGGAMAMNLRTVTAAHTLQAVVRHPNADCLIDLFQRLIPDGQPMSQVSTLFFATPVFERQKWAYYLPHMMYISNTVNPANDIYFRTAAVSSGNQRLGHVSLNRDGSELIRYGNQTLRILDNIAPKYKLPNGVADEAANRAADGAFEVPMLPDPSDLSYYIADRWHITPSPYNNPTAAGAGAESPFLTNYGMYQTIFGNTDTVAFNQLFPTLVNPAPNIGNLDARLPFGTYIKHIMVGPEAQQPHPNSMSGPAAGTLAANPLSAGNASVARFPFNCFLPIINDSNYLGVLHLYGAYPIATTLNNRTVANCNVSLEFDGYCRPIRTLPEFARIISTTANTVFANPVNVGVKPIGYWDEHTAGNPGVDAGLSAIPLASLVYISHSHSHTCNTTTYGAKKRSAKVYFGDANLSAGGLAVPSVSELAEDRAPGTLDYGTIITNWKGNPPGPAPTRRQVAGAVCTVPIRDEIDLFEVFDSSVPNHRLLNHLLECRFPQSYFNTDVITVNSGGVRDGFAPPILRTVEESWNNQGELKSVQFSANSRYLPGKSIEILVDLLSKVADGISRINKSAWTVATIKDHLTTVFNGLMDTKNTLVRAIVDKMIRVLTAKEIIDYETRMPACAPAIVGVNRLQDLNNTQSGFLCMRPIQKLYNAKTNIGTEFFNYRVKEQGSGRDTTYDDVGGMANAIINIQVNNKPTNRELLIPWEDKDLCNSEPYGACWYKDLPKLFTPNNINVSIEPCGRPLYFVDPVNSQADQELDLTSSVQLNTDDLAPFTALVVASFIALDIFIPASERVDQIITNALFEKDYVAPLMALSPKCMLAEGLMMSTIMNYHTGGYFKSPAEGYWGVGARANPDTFARNFLYRIQKSQVFQYHEHSFLTQNQAAAAGANPYLKNDVRFALNYMYENNTVPLIGYPAAMLSDMVANTNEPTPGNFAFFEITPDKYNSQMVTQAETIALIGLVNLDVGTAQSRVAKQCYDYSTNLHQQGKLYKQFTENIGKRFGDSFEPYKLFDPTFDSVASLHNASIGCGADYAALSLSRTAAPSLKSAFSSGAICLPIIWNVGHNPTESVSLYGNEHVIRKLLVASNDKFATPITGAIGNATDLKSVNMNKIASIQTICNNVTITLSRLLAGVQGFSSQSFSQQCDSLEKIWNDIFGTETSSNALPAAGQQSKLYFTYTRRHLDPAYEHGLDVAAPLTPGEKIQFCKSKTILLGHAKYLLQIFHEAFSAHISTSFNDTTLNKFKAAVKAKLEAQSANRNLFFNSTIDRVLKTPHELSVANVWKSFKHGKGPITITNGANARPLDPLDEKIQIDTNYPEFEYNLYKCLIGRLQAFPIKFGNAAFNPSVDSFGGKSKTPADTTFGGNGNEQAYYTANVLAITDPRRAIIGLNYPTGNYGMRNRSVASPFGWSELPLFMAKGDHSATLFNEIGFNNHYGTGQTADVMHDRNRRNRSSLVTNYAEVPITTWELAGLDVAYGAASAVSLLADTETFRKMFLPPTQIPDNATEQDIFVLDQANQQTGFANIPICRPLRDRLPGSFLKTTYITNHQLLTYPDMCNIRFFGYNLQMFGKESVENPNDLFPAFDAETTLISNDKLNNKFKDKLSALELGVMYQGAEINYSAHAANIGYAYPDLNMHKFWSYVDVDAINLSFALTDGVHGFTKCHFDPIHCIATMSDLADLLERERVYLYTTSLTRPISGVVGGKPKVLESILPSKIDIFDVNLVTDINTVPALNIPRYITHNALTLVALDIGPAAAAEATYRSRHYGGYGGYPAAALAQIPTVNVTNYGAAIGGVGGPVVLQIGSNPATSKVLLSTVDLTQAVYVFHNLDLNSIVVASNVAALIGIQYNNFTQAQAASLNPGLPTDIILRGLINAHGNGNTTAIILEGYAIRTYLTFLTPVNNYTLQQVTIDNRLISVKAALGDLTATSFDLASYLAALKAEPSADYALPGHPGILNHSLRSSFINMSAISPVTGITNPLDRTTLDSVPAPNQYLPHYMMPWGVDKSFNDYVAYSPQYQVPAVAAHPFYNAPYNNYNLVPRAPSVALLGNYWGLNAPGVYVYTHTVRPSPYHRHQASSLLFGPWSRNPNHHVQKIAQEPIRNPWGIRMLSGTHRILLADFARIYHGTDSRAQSQAWIYNQVHKILSPNYVINANGLAKTPNHTIIDAADLNYTTDNSLSAAPYDTDNIFNYVDPYKVSYLKDNQLVLTEFNNKQGDAMRKIGKYRFDTKLVRNLIFIHLVFNILSADIENKLAELSKAVVYGTNIFRPKLHEYSSNQSHATQNQERTRDISDWKPMTFNDIASS